MSLGTAQIIQGNALNLPLADASVDAVITSPPYFALRSYQDSGKHYQGQLGSEATPAEFLDALIAATREMVRVLKPSGSIFVNLGDKYAGGGGYKPDSPSNIDANRPSINATYRSTYRDRTPDGMRPKSLMGIPWRYAIRCIDELGLILRAEIIWSKPNGLPESVTDRVRRSHEQWFHLTRSPRYFSAVDEIKEEYAPSSLVPNKVGQNAMRGRAQMPGRMDETGYTPGWEPSQMGKLPGSVWTIPTQPLEVPPELGVAHFAAYPMEWPRRIIQGWTPNGICTVCGEGRRPLTAKGEAAAITATYATGLTPVSKKSTLGFKRTSEITGYACGCPTADTPTTPAVVLDPFMGTGTTLVVARALGRNSIGVDLSADYCRLAQWRVNNPGQMAAALQIEKPDVIPADQLSLFEDGMT